MKKLRPQVSEDLVKEVKGDRNSFEDGLRDLMLAYEISKGKLSSKSPSTYDFTKAVDTLLGLDGEMMDTSQTMTIRIEKGQVFVDIGGYMPFAKAVY